MIRHDQIKPGTCVIVKAGTHRLDAGKTVFHRDRFHATITGVVGDDVAIAISPTSRLTVKIADLLEVAS